jgi:uncharacterized protein (TIGR03118 family)
MSLHYFADRLLQGAPVMAFLLSMWLQATKRKAAKGARSGRGAKLTRPNRTVLRLEVLEDRTVPSAPALGPQGAYVQTNLVSDIPGLAPLTDANLKNPWGTSFSADGSFTISNQKTSVSTLYAVHESGVAAESPTVAIPSTAAGQGPTGQVSNDTLSFLVNGTPASFIYANVNGTITAWNSSAGTTARVEATTTGAVYTGLVMQSTASGDFLYAANPRQGRIDVFDSSFHRVILPAGAFVDPDLPARMVPFNVEDINGDLYVAYAVTGPPVAKTVAPEGSGAIAVFDASGNFIKQLTTGGKLASPWGITLAPHGFGQYSGDLLVGNFSYAASEINAFDPMSGAYLGTLTDSSGNTLLQDVNGLWDLTFGNRGNGGLPVTLYFTTGLNAEADGLFGALTPAPRPGIAPGRADAAGQEGALGIVLTELSPTVMIGNQAIGVTGANGSGDTVPRPAAMTWSNPATAPAATSTPQILPMIAATPNQDASDQLFAALAGSDDATWNAW